MEKLLYTTPYYKKAEEKIGTEKSLYLCTVWHKTFESIEKANEQCAKCDTHCDRRDYILHKRIGTRGFNMKPLADFDPLIKMKINFLPLEDNERITRVILYDEHGNNLYEQQRESD